jgi:nucleotide-binding universal stress UspA family protein
MKVMCAIGMQGGTEIIRRLVELIGPRHELYLLNVIDNGPRNTLEDYLHGPRLLRHPLPPPPTPGRPSLHPEHAQPIDEAEQAAGKTTLEEARQEAERAGFQIHTEIQKGKPEQVIVQLAQKWGCQLIAIRGSEGTEGRPRIGPESVGHTARFILDHAPCNVLLLREAGDG